MYEINIEYLDNRVIVQVIDLETCEVIEEHWDTTVISALSRMEFKTNEKISTTTISHGPWPAFVPSCFIEEYQRNNQLEA